VLLLYATICVSKKAIPDQSLVKTLLMTRRRMNKEGHLAYSDVKE